MVAGALLATRVPGRIDPRLVLAGCYAAQGLGVILTLFVSSLGGFIVSSALVGMFVTSMSFFAMQEARRLRPHHAARFMGLLTALYGIGQIAGSPLSPPWPGCRAAPKVSAGRSASRRRRWRSVPVSMS